MKIYREFRTVKTLRTHKGYFFNLAPHDRGDYRFVVQDGTIPFHAFPGGVPSNQGSTSTLSEQAW